MVVEMYGSRWNWKAKFNEWMMSLRTLVKELEEKNVCVIDQHCETALFMMKFHHLDYLREELGI